MNLLFILPIKQSFSVKFLPVSLYHVYCNLLLLLLVFCFINTTYSNHSSSYKKYQGHLLCDRSVPFGRRHPPQCQVNFCSKTRILIFEKFTQGRQFKRIAYGSDNDNNRAGTSARLFVCVH